MFEKNTNDGKSTGQNDKQKKQEQCIDSYWKDRHGENTSNKISPGKNDNMRRAWGNLKY